MSINYIISGIYNSRIRDEIFISDDTSSLDYGHQFMGSLHVVDSRSWTPSFVSLLFT